MDKLICPSCSSKCNNDARFCGQCGYSFVENRASQQFLPKEDVTHQNSRWLLLKQMIQFYGIFVGMLLGLGFFRAFSKSPWMDVCFVGLEILLVGFFLMKTWSETSIALQPRFPSIKVLLEIFAGTIGCLIFISTYFWGLKKFGWPVVDSISEIKKIGWPIGTALALTSISPAILEELSFRGIIQTRLEKILSANEAMIVQAALFSILHISIIIFISHFVMGLLVGWIRKQTGHIYVGIVLHALWNASIVYKDWYTA